MSVCGCVSGLTISRHFAEHILLSLFPTSHIHNHFTLYVCVCVCVCVCVLLNTGEPCNLKGLQASTIIFVLLCIVLAVALVISLIAVYRLRRGFVFVKSRGRRISLGGPNETYNRLNNSELPRKILIY